MYQRIETLCKKLGTSPTAVCERLTGSRGNLQNWKQGMIKPVVLVALCDYLSCSSDYLLGRTDRTTMGYDLTPDQSELVELWDRLDAVQKAEFKGELRGYVRAMESRDDASSSSASQ